MADAAQGQGAERAALLGLGADGRLRLGDDELHHFTSVYWTGPGDEPSPWGGSATTADGFADRADLVARYAAVSGRDVSQLPFYVSFAYWKLACILQGVYYRYLGGALGSRDPAELEPFVTQIDGAAARAAECLEALR